MAKSSSYHVKTTLQLFVPPPSAWLKPFTLPFHRGKTCPPPTVLYPLLPIISDQSLISIFSLVGTALSNANYTPELISMLGLVVTAMSALSVAKAQPALSSIHYSVKERQHPPPLREPSDQPTCSLVRCSAWRVYNHRRVERVRYERLSRKRGSP